MSTEGTTASPTMQREIVLDPSNGDMNSVVTRCLRLVDKAVTAMWRAEAIDTVQLWLDGVPPPATLSEVAQKLRPILEVLGEAIAKHTQGAEILEHVRQWVAQLRADLEQVIA